MRLSDDSYSISIKLRASVCKAILISDIYFYCQIISDKLSENGGIIRFLIKYKNDWISRIHWIYILSKIKLVVILHNLPIPSMQPIYVLLYYFTTTYIIKVQYPQITMPYRRTPAASTEYLTYIGVMVQYFLYLYSPLSAQIWGMQVAAGTHLL